MEKYYYLILDILTIAFPFFLSFESRLNFSKKWKHLFPAIGITSLIFIAWDSWFTDMGVWGFNSRYLTGIYFFNLPIEEILFFICIPYACVFTFEVVKFFRKENSLPGNGLRVSSILIIGLIAVGFKNYSHWYTAVGCLALGCYILFLAVVVRPPWLGGFYVAFLFMLIPFFIVNSILTGTALPEPVVWYNPAENLGIRILTIPIEDTFFGMLLILMNVTIFEHLQKHSTST